MKIQSDIKKAEADAAYAIRKAEKDSNLNQAEVDAKIMAMDKTIELQEKEASVKEQKLNAEVRKTADASKYDIEKKSEAELFRRQKEAEAKKIEQEKLAEALKIKAKGLAEAEALKQRAVGLKENNEAMLGIELIKQLPEVAKAIGEPLSKIGNITMFGEGCVGKTIGEMTAGLQQVIQGIGAGTGIDLLYTLTSNNQQNQFRSIHSTDGPSSISQPVAIFRCSSVMRYSMPSGLSIRRIMQ